MHPSLKSHILFDTEYVAQFAMYITDIELNDGRKPAIF